jgi:hypothetical protein
MATTLNKWTKEEMQSVVCFFWVQDILPTEIHRELVTVYGASVMAVQHM